MTSSEALDWMQAQHPDRSASAQKESWYHSHISQPRPPAQFTISVQPGFNHTPCQLFAGPSFEHCITLIQQATAAPIQGEPNNE